MDYNNVFLYNSLLISIFSLLISAVSTISMCFIFTKTAQKWWYVLIPVANAFILVETVGLPKWFALFIFLMFFKIPFIAILGFVWWAVISFNLSKRFGHGIGYGIGIAFLPFIFLPILAFGNSVYTKKNSSSLSESVVIK